MNPRFYTGSLDEATYTASLAADAGFPLDNLKSYNPADLWKSSANTNNQTLNIDFGLARPRNFCIIHNHNFSGMTTVVLEAADDSGYTTNLTTVVAQLVTPLTPAKFEFSPVNKRYWRIKFTNTNTVIPQLGQVFIDQKVEFAQTYNFGYKPKNEDFITTGRRAISGLRRSSQVHAGILRYDIKFSNVTGRFLEDYRWFIQKVRGTMFPYYFYDHDDAVFYMMLGNDFNPAEVKAYKIGDTVEIPQESQGVAQNPYTQQTNPMAVDLDGSTEYCRKSSPQNLDMNGAEKTTNGTFESNYSSWTNQGNHVGSRVLTDFYSGVACAEIVASGAGSVFTGNRVYGGCSAAETGKNHVIEFWAKSVSGNTSLEVGILSSARPFTITTSWAKYVWNISGTTIAGGDALIFALGGAGTFRIDDVSITQAFNSTILVWFKTTATNIMTIFDLGDNTTTKYIRLAINDPSTGKLSGVLYDGVNQPLATSTLATYNDGSSHLATLTVDRTGNIILYIDGIVQATAVNTAGHIVPINLILSVGIVATVQHFNGQIGELQIVRGYAMTAAQIADIYAKGIPKSYDQTQFPGATVVAHYKWRGVSDADFLKDETGYNNLTGTNVTQVLDQVIGSYQCIDL
jgi:hypothetical protein